MGLFSRNYSKPGKGVSKNEPQKAAIFTLFEIYFRKFWNLMVLNLLYFLVSALPIVIVAGLQAPFILGYFSANTNDPSMLPFFVIISCIFVVLGIGNIGPLHAGFIYIVRNYAEERHAFIWHDFIQCAKANLKQGLAAMLIDYAVSLLLCFNMYAINAMGSSVYINIISALNFSAFIIFIMMHMYVYQIMITFELSIWQIYKSAFLMVVSNISSALITFMFIIIIVSTAMLSPQLGFLLILVLLLSTVGFVYTFYANRRIKRTMIDNTYRFKSFMEMKDKIKKDV